MDDESISSGEPDLVLIRIRVPELNVEKCLQFQKDEVLWEVKQQSLAALPKVGKLQLFLELKFASFTRVMNDQFSHAITLLLYRIRLCYKKAASSFI